MWGLNALATAGQGFLEKLDDALENAVEGGGSGTEGSDNEDTADGDDGDGGSDGEDSSVRNGEKDSGDEEESDGAVLVGDEFEGEMEGDEEGHGEGVSGESHNSETRRTSIEDLAKKVAVLRAARDAEIERNKKLKKQSSARVAAAEAAAAEARETAELERTAASDLQRILEAAEKEKVGERTK
jgi:hypothetical protein